ncbi:hypothetical protein KFL_001170020 [Klebsormidium nitens]|uniref:Uncharacterized protein n=1 Tax=Klebsormidium nitens TaxID=105231 RepID=A0A1Y1I3A7_KLENI|nr:hypothetical protein KFL_001170020 [Klebsormidium nitens]|eukprot:GAQ82598.1 hypothetical protein KFL_001170020 [Klebsormidium nitens]
MAPARRIQDGKIIAERRPASHQCYSCFRVMVCHNGEIKVKEGNKPTMTYTEAWFRDEKEDFYMAAKNWCDGNGASLIGVLSTILQPYCGWSNKEKRHKIYKRLAYYAGYKERTKLPLDLERAIKEEFPEEEEANYTGFRPRA